ncbi:MAG: hypothetical protein AB1538_10235 [Bacillota bacterium]
MLKFKKGNKKESEALGIRFLKYFPIAVAVLAIVPVIGQWMDPTLIIIGKIFFSLIFVVFMLIGCFIICKVIKHVTYGHW